MNGYEPIPVNGVIAMKLELEDHEIAIILKALAELPHKESAALIRKIVHEDARQKVRGGNNHGN